MLTDPCGTEVTSTVTADVRRFDMHDSRHDRMLPQRSGMHEHAPGGSERREAVPRHLTGGCTTDRPRCLPPTAGNRLPPAHADEAVVRRLWQTVRWLPVCASRAPEAAPVGGVDVWRDGGDPARPHRCLLERLDRSQPAPGQDAGQRSVGLPGAMTHGDPSAVQFGVRPAPQTAGARPVAGAASVAATVRTGGRDAAPSGAGRRAAARRAAAAATPERRSAG